jgi:Tol biopolymer transport system component
LVGARGDRIWLLELLSPPRPSSPPSDRNLATTRVALFDTGSTEQDPVVSPDGRWMAYATMVDGVSAVCVRSTSGIGESRLITEALGATEPVWSGDGRELFYRQGDALMSVSVGSGMTLALGRSELLFRGRFATTAGGGRDYDVSPDGKHFVMVSEREPESFAREIRFVRHWAAKLPR